MISDEVLLERLEPVAGNLDLTKDHRHRSSSPVQSQPQRRKQKETKRVVRSSSRDLAEGDSKNVGNCGSSSKPSSSCRSSSSGRPARNNDSSSRHQRSTKMNTTSSLSRSPMKRGAAQKSPSRYADRTRRQSPASSKAREEDGLKHRGRGGRETRQEDHDKKDESCDFTSRSRNIHNSNSFSYQEEHGVGGADPVVTRTPSSSNSRSCLKNYHSSRLQTPDTPTDNPIKGISKNNSNNSNSSRNEGRRRIKSKSSEVVASPKSSLPSPLPPPPLLTTAKPSPAANSSSLSPLPSSQHLEYEGGFVVTNVTPGTISIWEMRKRFQREFPGEPLPSDVILRSLYRGDPIAKYERVERYQLEFPGEPIPSDEVLKKLYAAPTPLSMLPLAPPLTETILQPPPPPTSPPVGSQNDSSSVPSSTTPNVTPEVATIAEANPIRRELLLSLQQSDSNMTFATEAGWEEYGKSSKQLQGAASAPSSIPFSLGMAALTETEKGDHEDEECSLRDESTAGVNWRGPESNASIRSDFNSSHSLRSFESGRNASPDILKKPKHLLSAGNSSSHRRQAKIGSTSSQPYRQNSNSFSSDSSGNALKSFDESFGPLKDSFQQEMAASTSPSKHGTKSRISTSKVKRKEKLASNQGSDKSSSDKGTVKIKRDDKKTKKTPQGKGDEDGNHSIASDLYQSSCSGSKSSSGKNKSTWWNLDAADKSPSRRSLSSSSSKKKTSESPASGPESTKPIEAWRLREAWKKSCGTQSAPIQPSNHHGSQVSEHSCCSSFTSGDLMSNGAASPEQPSQRQGSTTVCWNISKNLTPQLDQEEFERSFSSVLFADKIQTLDKPKRRGTKKARERARNVAAVADIPFDTFLVQDDTTATIATPTVEVSSPFVDPFQRLTNERSARQSQRLLDRSIDFSSTDEVNRALPSCSQSGDFSTSVFTNTVPDERMPLPDPCMIQPSPRDQIGATRRNKFVDRSKQRLQQNSPAAGWDSEIPSVLRLVNEDGEGVGPENGIYINLNGGQDPLSPITLASKKRLGISSRRRGGRQ